MVLAQHRAPGHQFVARGRDRRLDLRALFVRRRDLALDPRDVGQHRPAIGDREGLRGDEFALDAQEAVEHPRARPGGIFAHRKHGAEASVARCRAADFQRLLAEGDPARRQIAVEPHARQQHRNFDAAVEQLREKLAGLGIDGRPRRLVFAARMRLRRKRTGDDLQHPGAIGLQRIDDIGDGVLEFAPGVAVEIFAGAAREFSNPPQHPVDRADLALKAPANDGEIEIVDEHPLARQARHVASVELLAESDIELARYDGGNLPTDDVGIEREAAVVERAHQGVARGQAQIDLALVGGLETESVELDAADEKSLLGAQGLLVRMPDIGHVRADRLFARRNFGKFRFWPRRTPEHCLVRVMANRNRRPRTCDCACADIWTPAFESHRRSARREPSAHRRSCGSE